MKVTNKSELFKAAWKMFRNVKNKISVFGEALKMAWTMYKAYLVKQNRPALSTEEKEMYKAMKWAELNVCRVALNLDFAEWKAFYQEHKSENTIWKLVAKFARIQDSKVSSFA